VQITIDLDSLTVSTSADHSIPVTMPESARDALMAGRWDPIQELLDNDGKIDERAKALGYVA
jgi:3-isopropylmalate/(R)-2-methylmalate dehydratase small subunit